MTTTALQLVENPGHVLWEARRRETIGGSEAYELLEEAQYGKGCRTALAYRKLGATPDFPDYEPEDVALFKRGALLEPLVAAMYQHQTGRVLRKPPMDSYGFPIPRRHHLLSWAAVNTDRIILSGPNSPVGDLEIKTRDQGPFLRVKRLGPFPGDLLQLQWSLFVTGHQWGSLATLGVFGGLPLIITPDTPRDPELHKVFIREGSEFADIVWGAGDVPAPDIPASDQRCKVCVYRMTCRGQQIDYDEARALAQVKASSKTLMQIDDPELATTLGEIDILKEEADAVHEAAALAKQRAAERLDGIDAALVRGYGKVYRLPIQSHRFDSQRLRFDRPDLYEKYMVRNVSETDYYLKRYPNKAE